MTAEAYFLVHAEINWFYISFVFFSTLVLYSFPTFTETNFSPEYSERHKWISEHKKLLLVFSVIGVLVCGTLTFFFPFKFILSFAPVALIAFAYFFPQTHLRSIAGLKAGIVALVWTCVTAIYPLLLVFNLDMSGTFENSNVTVMILNFLFIFPLCVIYNVRDIEADRKAGVKTFPVIYGTKATIAVCMFSLVLFSALVIISADDIEIKLILLLSAAASAVFLFFASEKRSDYYYSFWIDGMIVLQAILVILAGN